MPASWQDLTSWFERLPQRPARRWLAVEPDRTEIRVLAGSRGDGGLIVEQMFRVPLAESADGNQVVAAQQALAEALAARHLRSWETFITVPRSRVELKQLSLPPTPDEELASMVQWQALREFQSLGEGWALDYLPRAAVAGEPRTVLAAALGPEQVTALFDLVVRSTVPRHLVLRPAALASRFLRLSQAEQASIRLLVDWTDDEVDLTVIEGRDVVFMRTARLPDDIAAQAEDPRALVGELRRTLAAAHHQMREGRVEAVYLCGDQPVHRALAERLEAELRVPVWCFDPWQGVRIERGATTEREPRPERFGALLGVLLDAQDRRPQAIDFLNPRRPAAPPSRRPVYVLSGAVAAALALLVVAVVWWRLAALDRQIADLSQQSQQLDRLLKNGADVERSAAAVGDWLGGDVVWLDELARLADRLPPPQDVMLTQVRLLPRPQGGVVEIEGVVREAAVIDALEQRLRDPRRLVEGHGRTQDTARKNYTWQFKSSIVVEPNDQGKVH